MTPYNVTDNLYFEFYDPSEDFLEEPRAFCYELSSQLINQAKRNLKGSWYESDETIKGILLLLYTWNFASPVTKKLTFNVIHQLLRNTKDRLILLDNRKIIDADDEAFDVIKPLFDIFRKELGQTGSSKALSLLNPELFVMWDTKIRRRLNRKLIPGIGNGESGDSYVIFLKGIQRIIKEYNIENKLPKSSILAKKIDEYHFVRIIMNKDLKKKQIQNAEKHLSPKLELPDNLRGRSIHVRVIPTVCNLKNTLAKLSIMNWEYSSLKPWERRSYDAYLIDKIKSKLITSDKKYWKEIIKNHILKVKPTDLGASCIDIYLVAYVADSLGIGKKIFFQYIKNNGISQQDNTAQAIWQVGKGDGVFLGLLDLSGRIIDLKFFRDWIKG